MTRPTQLVDTAMARNPAEPRDRVCRGFDPRQVPIERQEYLLGHILGRSAAAEGVQRKAEDHRLVLFDNRREGVGVAGTSPCECVVVPRRLCRGGVNVFLPLRNRAKSQRIPK